MYSKKQRKQLQKMSFCQDIGSEYMHSSEVWTKTKTSTDINGIRRSIETLGMFLMRADNLSWYALPYNIQRCNMRCASRCQRSDMGAFVDTIFASVKGVSKVSSGAMQTLCARVRNHQTDLLPHEEWTVCRVIFCTTDIEVAKQLETIQNHIVHNISAYSNGHIATPNAERSLISRGLHHSRELETARLYVLYILTR